jgi:bifunctional enzyme CysN/CysC
MRAPTKRSARIKQMKSEKKVSGKRAGATQSIEAFIRAQAEQDLLRFITCGSVDDGKSTLIGRLLWETQNIYDDHLLQLQKDSAQFGTQGKNPDFALLVDGLAAEREQKITIDVAYRFFSTPQRKFIVADTPGHEQYTRNMVVGASTAQAAVLLINAQAGLLAQTKRHAYIAHLMGVSHLILAINKMDLVRYKASVYEAIQDEFMRYAKAFGFQSISAIPVCAIDGENITRPSKRTPWYHGPTILQCLESLPTTTTRASSLQTLFPVQWVNRPNAGFRGYSGTLMAGTIAVGDTVQIARTQQIANVEAILGSRHPKKAIAGEALTITLDRKLDCSRGDIVIRKDDAVTLSDQCEARLIWLGNDAGHTGRLYDVQLANQSTSATIGTIKHVIEIESMQTQRAKVLASNQIALCELAFTKPLMIAPFADQSPLGSFILIDRHSHETVAAGLITHSLRRGENIHPQTLSITKTKREAHQGHAAKVIWLTGLSGSGKSTLANALEVHLHQAGKRAYILDGDNIRGGLNKDLGFTDTDRIENIRRIAEVAKLMMDAGLIVITAFISPFRAERDMAKHLIGEENFIEVFINTPLAVCEKRDPKGLYRKARLGQIPNMTGISSPYEPPENPTIVIDGGSKTSSKTLIQTIDRLLA